MISKHKLYKIALVSIVLVLMLVSTACAMRFGDFGNVILKTDPSTQSVDFLKFPVCGCDDGFGSFLDHFRHCSHESENCTEYKHDNKHDNQHDSWNDD